jgi:hypothetical protein
MSYEKQYQEELDFLSGNSFGKGFLNNDKMDELGLVEYKVGPDSDAFLSVISPDPEKGVFGKRLYIHYNVGPRNNTILCPAQMSGKKCPVCELRELAKKHDDAATADALRWAIKYLMFVVDMETDESENDGVKVYIAPKTVVKNMISLSKNRRTGAFINLVDPKDGKVIVFRRDGKAKNKTDYNSFELEERDPLKKEWLDAVVDFDEILQQYSYDEIKNMMGEQENYGDEIEDVDVNDEDNNDDEEVENTNRSSRRSRQSNNKDDKSTKKSSRRRRNKKTDVEETGDAIDEEIETDDDDLSERLKKKLMEQE